MKETAKTEDKTEAEMKQKPQSTRGGRPRKPTNQKDRKNYSLAAKTSALT